MIPVSQLLPTLSNALSRPAAYHLLLTTQASIIACITDDPNGSKPAKQLLGPALWQKLVRTVDGREQPSDNLSHILALRGLLACDVLFNCLQKRHGVNYGINRCALPPGPTGR